MTTGLAAIVMADVMVMMANVLLLSTPKTPEKCSRNSINVSMVISELLSDYDPHLMPDPDGVNVTVEIHVQEVSSLSELTSDFELDIMYSEIWQDKRLSYQHLDLCAKNITLKAAFREKIWTPDTCIINSKSSKIHSSPSENTFVLLYESGRIWANYRMKVKAPCRLDLSMFPFDTQRCSLVFESYSYNGEEVRLSWLHEPITIMGQIDLPDFQLSGWRVDKEKLQYPNGIWERLDVTFFFSRRYGFYLFQAYFPTALTVLSSWVSFLLDTKSVSARITLGVSSLLALTFQFGTVLRHLPRVSYIKCLDVWMITCVIFIFLTLVQLAIVCQLSRRERERQVGSQIITQWLQSVRKRQVPMAAARPPNGEAISSLKRNVAEFSADPPAVPNRAAANRQSSRFEKWRQTSKSSPRWRNFLDRVADDETTTENQTTSNQTVQFRIEEPRTVCHGAEALTEIDTLLSHGDKKRHSNLCVDFFRWCWSGLGTIQITSVRFDRMSMAFFPLSFLIFNAVYWSYYLFRITQTAQENTLSMQIKI